MKSRNKFRAICVASTLAIAAVPTMALADWEPVLGQKLEDLFANKTHKWAEGGKSYDAHYEPGGDVMILVDGTDLRPSFWRIYGGTGFCLVDRIKETRSCYEIQKDNESFRITSREDDGRQFDLEITDGIDTF